MVTIDAFVQALQSGDSGLVQAYLAEHPGEVNAKLPKWAERRVYTAALHCAACSNQTALVRILVETYQADVNRQVKVEGATPGLWTPLHYAEDSKAYAGAAELLRLGADPFVKNSDEKDTVAFCLSNEIKKLLEGTIYDKILRRKEEADKAAQEKARQEKIASVWKRTTLKEVVHDHNLPDSGYHLTDVFNFEARSWRSITKDLKDKGVTQTIIFFDDMPDKSALHQAFEKLQELGGTADGDSICSMTLHGKSLSMKRKK